jgi:hypothetical protein
MPRYKHIKTFGCAVYALKPHAKAEGKMAPRSEKLWLLGYEATTIFRLWNPVKRAVRISRNVTFNEAELAAGPIKPTTSPTTEPTPESNAESNAESDAESDAKSDAESDAESDTESNAESSIESTDQPTTFRPTTRSMTRKSTSQEAVGALKSTNTVDLAIVMPERDTEVEYEDWTTKVLFPVKAYYATTTMTGYNDDQPSYDRAMKGPEVSL